jgi:uncharacterized repeat protein (TIGR03803 family)
MIVDLDRFFPTQLPIRTLFLATGDEEQLPSQTKFIFSRVFSMKGARGQLDSREEKLKSTGGKLMRVTTKETWYRRISLAFVLLAATAVVASAQTYHQLAVFPESGTDGAYPWAPVVQGPDGNLYGTTTSGGNNNNGVIFKVTPAGKLTVLYTFCETSGCPDGSTPEAGLVVGTDGNLYGTTAYDGTITGSGVASGTIFKITLAGKLTTLYTFCNEWPCKDGATPMAGLVEGTDGNFYGTTHGGGAQSVGVVFKITPEGALTTLYSFCTLANCTDGEEPVAGLVQGTSGDFYGTTYWGGATGNDNCLDGVNGCGTVFKITSTGTLTTLYDFCSPAGSSCPDGASPVAGLVQGTDGNFYGTTKGGGSDVSGTVFKITPAGKLTTLVNSGLFYPEGTLIQATDGNFYGTSFDGGAQNSGEVFKVTSSGTLTVEYSFEADCDCDNDGSGPVAGLFQATNGTLYGTTSSGYGTSGNGTVYSLSVGLGAFVELIPTSGKVGTKVKILGTNLTGATSVTFNGTAAAFTVVSATEITATVPSGATTGTVKVTTPSATLASNVAFRVP